MMSRLTCLGFASALLLGLSACTTAPTTRSGNNAAEITSACYGPDCCKYEAALRFEPHRLNCQAIQLRNTGQHRESQATLSAAIAAADRARISEPQAANEVLCYALNEQADLALQSFAWGRVESLSQANIDACTARFGVDSVHSVEAQYGYANRLLSSDRLDQARAEFTTVLTRSRALRLRGLESFSIDALGRIADMQGDITLARPLLQQAIDLKREVFGDTSAELAVSYTNMGASYAAAGDLKTGVSWYLQASTLYRTALGPLADRTLGVETALAISYLEMKALEHAERWFLDLIPRATQTYGLNAPQVNDLHNDYGVVLTRSHRYPEALQQFKLALDARRLNSPNSTLHGYSALNSTRIQREIAGCASATELRNETLRVAVTLMTTSTTLDDETREFIKEATAFEQDCNESNEKP